MRKLILLGGLALMPAALQQIIAGPHGPGAMYAQSSPPVPAEYQDLYSSLTTQLASFESVVKAGGTYPTAFSAELQSANSARGPAVLTSPYRTVLMELDSLKALGVKAVNVGIHFPILYSSYYANATDYQQYLNFYTQVARDVRARGLKLIVESGLVIDEPGITNLSCLPYYNSLTVDQYERGRAQVAVTIAQQLKPDYLSVVNEPDVEALQSGKPELGTLSGSTGMLNVILSAMQQAGVTGVSVGAGVGTWMASYDTFVRNYSNTAIQYIDMHIIPVNYDYLTRAMNIADIAHGAGKAVGISQAWLQKVRNSELGVMDYSQTAVRDPFSFWQPLDISFLRTMVEFSHYKQIEFFSPFYTTYFHAYLDYSITSSLPVDQLMALVSAEVSQSVTTAQYTPTGLAYSRLILSAPDTTAPTVPTGLAAMGSSATVIHVTWNASTDNVGVAGYAIFRNGSLAGTTSSTDYFDSNLSPSASNRYSVWAYDAAGNLSAPEGPVIGTTLSPPDTTPPSVPASLSARAVSNSQINLSWLASTDNLGVAGYIVYKGASAAALIMYAAATTNSYVDTRVGPSTPYYYAVFAYDAKGNKSALSATVSAVTPQEPPPSVPASLGALAVSYAQVNLSWTPSVSGTGVSGYLIYRGSSPAALSLLGINATTAYADTRVMPLTTYYYAVAAYDTFGVRSALSGTVSVTTPPSPPASIPVGLTTLALSGSQVNLTWLASTSVAGMGGYLIYRGTSASTLTMIGQASTASYTDTKVLSSTTYYYAIVAYDKWGSRSAQSAVGFVRTP
jgi:fibronectin type 3 domain-containing protein